MKKLLFSFFLICCAVPLTAEAADLFNTNGSFKVAKAVKLGRGSAYSVSASSNVNTGGKISSKKNLFGRLFRLRHDDGNMQRLFRRLL